MMDKKLNLGELFDSHFIDDCDEVYDAKNEIISFAKDFGKKLLELAAKNAKCEDGAIIDMGFTICSAEVDKQSILDTINQVDYE